MEIPFPLQGGSAAISRVREQIEKAAETDFPVLLRGESGCGKQSAAEWLHSLSPRRKNPFIETNSACWNQNSLVHSILFGHEKGAFTGAGTRYRGCFERAHRGTLFLDEIGELDPAIQAMLLKVLDQGLIEPIGAREPVRVDVRLVTATNRDLALEVVCQRFRQDLLSRISLLEIVLPSLEERIEDLPHLWQGICRRRGLVLDCPQDLVDRVESKQMKGNLRDLERLAIQSAVWGGSATPRVLQSLPGG